MNKKIFSLSEETSAAPKYSPAFVLEENRIASEMIGRVTMEFFISRRCSHA